MTRARVRAIWVFITLMALCAFAVHVFAVLPLVDQTRDWPLAWPLALAVGFMAAELLPVHLRLGREAYAFSMMELPLVVGLFFVRPDLLVVSRVLGSLVAFVIQRKDLQKMAFNTAMFALETSVAVSVWHLVLQDADPLGPRGWLATLVTALLISLLGSLLVGVVITIATGARPQVFGEVVGLGQVADVANACFALVAVYILATDWRAAWLLALLGAVLLFAYRSYEGARQRSESLERVNRFTELVGREVELEAVVRTVLVEVRSTFEVGAVHLRLTHEDGTLQDWCLDEETLSVGSSALVDAVAGLAAEGTVVVPRRTRDHYQQEVLARIGVRDCALVPLRSEGKAVGSLLVADKLGDVETFTAADLRQLGALANHAAVAIDNALRAHLIIAQAEERERLAMYDELTGLANRRLLGIRMAEALAEEPVAVVLLGIDRFKEVNDTLGHEVGDRLLCLVAERLLEAAEPEATVAHVGGDEFAILLPGADDLYATTCASIVQRALARAFDLDGIQVAVEASMGVAVAEVGTPGGSILRWADLAMYVAKEHRTGLEVYRPELDDQDSSRLGLLADLRTAVTTNALTVHYQPKVHLKTGLIQGVEALVRWHHPELGTIGPDEFIPLAEHSSLITPLTMFVLRNALRDCAAWRESRGAPFTVAVNISPRSLLDASFVDEVARALSYADVEPQDLTLEITETSLMLDPERAIAALERLRELGVRLSVDDLGTGYSSLAYLQRLPVDEVKIDQSFVASFPDSSAQAVVSAIVDLGHRLGHRVVAEGVEDLEAFVLLGELGCDSAQGYWLGRPVSATRLTEVLGTWSPPVPKGRLRRVT